MSQAMRSVLGVGLCLLIGVMAGRAAEPAAATAPAPYDAIDQYESRPMQGWTVLVNKRLLTKDDLAATSLKELDSQLYLASTHLPAKTLGVLKKVKIWMELDDKAFPGGVYHPSADWLEQHGHNPAKAKCVEIGNARHLIDWSHDQPYMLLHELSHAYHDQVLGYDNPAVKAAFADAVESKRYESVLRASGRKERHYALTNAQEFFAEMSESYFGTNDFYPFVRAELQAYDPKTYAMMGAAWGVK